MVKVFNSMRTYFLLMNIKRMKIYIKIFSKGSRKVKIIKIIGHNIINTESLKTLKYHIFLKKH